MAADFKPYWKRLEEAKKQLSDGLMNDKLSPVEAAALRGAIRSMEELLSKSPESVLVFPANKQKFKKPEDVWYDYMLEQAYKAYVPQDIDPTTFRQKASEYEAFVKAIRERVNWSYTFADKYNGVVYVMQQNAQVDVVVTEIIYEFGRYARLSTTAPNYLKNQPLFFFHQMLSERQDLVEALRYAQTLPADLSSWTVTVDQPAMVQVIEIGISFIPYVGTTVSLYEAATGRDIFGYKLDNTDRAILAAGALLPFVSRFVKGGRALYTASRMSKLYGRDAGRLGRILAISERYSSQPALMKKIADARKAKIAGKVIDQQLAKDVSVGIKALNLQSATQPTVTTLKQEVVDAIKKLGLGQALVGELDAPAIQRIFEKGSRPKMRGQALEELVEARMAKWLQDPAGAAALGIDKKDVVFLPGHMLKHPNGMRQITDGVLARRNGNVLEILGIFEAKSSKKAVAELRKAKVPLSAADRLEIRMVAREELEAAQELAAAEGRTYTRTLADHEADLLKPMTQQEEGQIRRSIERLYQNDQAGHLQKIYVGTELLEVRISPKNTKVFGVVPKGTNLPELEAECRKLGLNFEALGMDVSTGDLNKLVDALAKLNGVP
jgi:hypothetical protein